MGPGWGGCMGSVVEQLCEQPFEHAHTSTSCSNTRVCPACVSGRCWGRVRLNYSTPAFIPFTSAAFCSASAFDAAQIHAPSLPGTMGDALPFLWVSVPVGAWPDRRRDGGCTWGSISRRL